MNEEPVVAELFGLGWSRETLAVWRRAGHRCEYCDADLLASIDDHLYGSNVDHVVPGAGNDAENLALSCKMFNFVKRDQSFADPDRPLARSEIVARVRARAQPRCLQPTLRDRDCGGLEQPATAHQPDSHVGDGTYRQALGAGVARRTGPGTRGLE